MEGLQIYGHKFTVSLSEHGFWNEASVLYVNPKKNVTVNEVGEHQEMGTGIKLIIIEKQQSMNPTCRICMSKLRMISAY